MSKAVAVPSPEDVLFLSEISYYDRNGFPKSIPTVNKDFSSLSDRENSTYFSKENSFLDSYIRCIEDATKLQESISTFRNNIDPVLTGNYEKNLDTRCLEQVKEPTSDTSAPNSDELIKELVETLKTIEDQFRKIVSPGKTQDSLDLNRLKSIESERENYVKKLEEWEIARNITRTFKVIKSSGFGEYVDEAIAARIQDQGNIDALKKILENTPNIVNRPSNSVPDIIPQNAQFVTTPQGCLENVKMISDAFSTAFQELMNLMEKTKNYPIDDLQKNMVQIFNGIMGNMGNLKKILVKVPNLNLSLEGVYSEGKLAKNPVSIKISKLLGDTNCLTKWEDEITEEAEKEVKNQGLDLKKYTFENAKFDPKFDYEFRLNTYMYAYLQCLMEKNNAKNEEILKKICHKIYNKKIGLDASSDEHHEENPIQPFSDEHTEHDVQSLPDGGNSFDVDDGSAYIPENNAINATSDVGTSPDFMGSNLRKSDNSQGAMLRRQAASSDDNGRTPTLVDMSSDTEDVVEPQSNATTSDKAQNTADSSNLNLDSVQNAVKHLNGEYAKNTENPFVDGNNKPLTLEEINAELEKQHTKAICKLGSPEQAVLITYLVQFFAKYYNKKSHTSAAFVKTLRNALKKQGEALTPATEFLIKAIKNCEYSFHAKTIKATLSGKTILELTKNDDHEIKVKIRQNRKIKKAFNIFTQQNLDALFRDIFNNLNKTEGEKNDQKENKEKET